VDTVRWIVPQLIEHRRIVRPGLGVTLAPDQVAEELGVEGVLILDVQEGSAAEKGGLRPTRRDPRMGEVRLGDVIVAIDGMAVRSSRDLFAALDPHRIGDRVRVTFLRDDRTREVTITLQELEETIGTGTSRSQGLASSRPQ
jgi:S1-C subfamily serine protease